MTEQVSRCTRPIGRRQRTDICTFSCMAHGFGKCKPSFSIILSQIAFYFIVLITTPIYCQVFNKFLLLFSRSPLYHLLIIIVIIYCLCSQHFQSNCASLLNSQNCDIRNGYHLPNLLNLNRAKHPIILC